MRYSTLSFLKSEWGEEMGNIRDLKKFEEIAKYQFRDFGLLRQAVTHSSYANEKRLGKNKCNERLEFLGDAVLELISSEFLYGLYPDVPEGELTKKRASMVCEPSLAMSARDIQLPDFLLLGKGEEYTGGRERDSITSDALEAVIGAIYLDGGIECAKDFILRFVLNDLDNKSLFYDSKTVLQEIVQNQGKVPEYVLTGCTGPDHDKRFFAEVHICGEIYGKGKGHTKKAAEQAAAYEAVLSLRK
jgi:ribonuclease-3